MSTVLRTFPEISRQGAVATLWSAAIPANIMFLHLQGQASDPVLSDPANVVTFTVYVSPDGQDATQQIINIEPWQGGTHTPHGGGAAVPNLIDVTFGPLTQFVGYRVKLTADINLVSGIPMVVGGTVTSLP